MTGSSYYYQLSATDWRGETVVLGPVSATAGTTIQGFAVTRIAPNPSFGAVRIEYTVPSTAPVDMSVIDLRGRQVAHLANGSMTRGRYTATWNGQTPTGKAPSGVYFVRFHAAGKEVVRRFVLAR